MKQRTDNERLLADVLTPETDSEFSANVLAATLRGVRRQRHARQLRRYGGALAVLLAVAFTASLVLRQSVKPELVQVPQPLSYQLVVSQPLTASQWVTTEPLTSNQSIVSTATSQLVQTVAGGFEEIGDDKLLSLAAPQIVALVRRGPNEAELIFVSPLPENSDSHQN